MRIHEEQLPLKANARYDAAPNAYCVYINKARQVAKMGPGLKTFDIPLVPGITKGEISYYAAEIFKVLPLANEINVIHGGPDRGVGIYATAIDPAYNEP